MNTEDADKLLQEVQGRFPVVMVIGLDGSNLLDIVTNFPNYPAMQWLLNKASFELNMNEKASDMQQMHQKDTVE